MRVFICDDNRDYRTLIKLVLPEPFEIVGEAADGQEAIDHAPEADPDVLLLDLNMPRLNGYEALPRLRQVLSDETKIIVLTSGREEDERARAINAGADGFVRKPESVMDLADEIRAQLAA